MIAWGAIALSVLDENCLRGYNGKIGTWIYKSAFLLFGR